MAEAVFSEDGKYFSTISQDGRLRIWDTESNVLKQEYTPDLHLTSPPSCLQWISVAQSSGHTQKGPRRKSSVSEAETQCIVLGTTSGKILIYSVAEAKVETVLSSEKNSDISQSRITCLDWNRRYGLFSCNKEGFVHEWDLQNAAVRYKYNVNIESKNKQANSISAIKIVPHNKKTPAKFLVTASWQIRIWRLNGGDSEVVKSLGHNAAPKALLALGSLKDTCWLIEGSQTERLLSFWDVTVTDDHIPQVNGADTTPTKKKRKKSTSTPIVVSTPTYNFVLEDAPKLINVDVKAEDGGTRLSLAAVTRSGVVHYYGHMLNGASAKPIKPSVTIQVTTADAKPLPLQCCHLTPTSLLLGYTNGAATVFERVTPDLSLKTQVLIRGETKEPKKKNKKNEVNKVREDTADKVTYVEPMGGVSRKRATPGAKIEVPMEVRLANLTVDLKARGQAAVSQNMTKLLMQGLHSKDKRLIMTVLQENKPQVAFHTVSHLPAEYVPMLLEQLVDMATRRTGLCASVCTWLEAVLRAHAALLLASAGAGGQDYLNRILAVFAHRRSHLCQLLNLKGRLSLTLAQREARDEPQTQEPLLEYHDTTSDEEMEVDREGSGSEAQSWREDDSGASDSNASDSNASDSEASAGE